MPPKSPLRVLFKGSDSTCLRRLGLSLGSIFAVLFCDPLDLEGGQELRLREQTSICKPLTVLFALHCGLHCIHIPFHSCMDDAAVAGFGGASLIAFFHIELMS